MTFEEIQAEFASEGVVLTSDLWVLYRHRGLIPEPTEDGKYPPDSASECAAALSMFAARRTVGQVKAARDIGRLVLRWYFVRPGTPIEDEPQLRELVMGRPGPALLSVDWVQGFLQYTPTAPKDEERPDYLALRVDLLRLALDKKAILARRDLIMSRLFPEKTEAPPDDPKKERRDRLEEAERSVKEGK